MKYATTLLILLLHLLLAPAAVGAEPEEKLTPDMIEGESAILIDGTTGTVLFEKAPNVPLYPASITKIATGIYAIEHGNPDDIVTVSKKARYVEGTRVYLAEGEQVPLWKLEYGLLMHSGNDAAIAIAEHLAGSEEAFAEKLNAYLKEKVGITNTHFTNPHGLHDPNHYTTASDMAKIARYAMQNPTFRKISATNRLPWDGKEWKSELVNHNKLLRRYEGATGIKNGFTDQAMHTLVGSAKRGNSEFIAVTMKTSTSEAAYRDITRMLDYAFAHYETRLAAKAGETFVLATSAASERQERFHTQSDVFVTVPLNDTLETEVSPTGELIVRTSSGQTFEFPLKREPLPAVVSASIATEPKADGNLPQHILFFLWLAFNLLMALYVYARVKKRRNARHYYARKRADW